MAEEGRYRYVALDPAGRKVRGVIEAAMETAAFEELTSGGYSPLSIKAARAGRAPAKRGLTDREASEFLSSLAELLGAGADIRLALGILMERLERPAGKTLCQTLIASIESGEALGNAFGDVFSKKQAVVGAMVAGGEASGDLAGGLRRAADILQSRIKLRDQITSVMAYPTFVLVSAVLAVLVILFVVVPTIAPLTSELGATPSPALAIMISISDFARANWPVILIALISIAGALLAAGRAGLLTPAIERLMIDGPANRTVGGLVFGGFAVSLGTLLSAGAPITEALRLSTGAVSMRSARQRLGVVSDEVRQGEMLSNALGRVKGFPQSIVRLAAVGEASNSVGALLSRSGGLEEQAALRRIETAGRMAGPIMIVIVGALLGTLMAALLSAVSTVGEAAIQ